MIELGQAIVSLLAVAVMGLAALGCGQPLLRRWNLAPTRGLTLSVWGFAIGLVLIGYLILGLGLVGLLQRPLIVVLTIMAAFWGLSELAQAWFIWHEVPTDDLASDTPPLSGLHRWWVDAAMAAAAVAGLASAISALAPPTDPAGLALHIELPARCLENHRLVMVDGHSGPGGLGLVHAWYLWALALDGGVATQLASWGVGVMLAFAVYELAKPVLGVGGARLAAALCLLVPAIELEMHAPRIELALCCFAMLCLASVGQLREAPDGGQRCWLVQWIAAACIAISPWGIAWVAAVFVCEQWRAVRSKVLPPATRPPIGIPMLLGVACAAAWYAPQWIALGSWGPLVDWAQLPVQYFDSRLLGTVIENQPAALVERGLRAALQFLGEIGPWPLLFLPGIFLVRRLRGLGPLLAVASLYGAVALVVGGQGRWILLAPIGAVAAAWCWMELDRLQSPTQIAARACVAICVILSIVPSWRTAASNFAVAVGWESRTAYLRRTTGVYRAAHLYNAMHQPGDRLLTQDPCSYYFRGPVVGHDAASAINVAALMSDERPEMAGVLRAAGFTHLLLVERYRDLPAAAAGDQEAHIGWPERDPKGLLCLADYMADESALERRRYRLFLLR